MAFKCSFKGPFQLKKFYDDSVILWKQLTVNYFVFRKKKKSQTLPDAMLSSTYEKKEANFTEIFQSLFSYLMRWTIFKYWVPTVYLKVMVLKYPAALRSVIFIFFIFKVQRLTGASYHVASCWKWYTWELILSKVWSKARNSRQEPENVMLLSVYIYK